jgi:RNA polymerase sigma-70 factor (ECF subfamily)
MPDHLPTPEQELHLHQRLMERDPIAPKDVAETFLDALLGALQKKNRRSIPLEFIEEAVHLALICFIKSPSSFDPARSKADRPLFAFLLLASQRDLQTRLKQESRHAHSSLEIVELSADEGKYIEDADPLASLAHQEDVETAKRIADEIRDVLTEIEGRCFELLLTNERSTAAFAQAMNIEHLSKVAQENEVKRMKDKLKKRIERRDHG